MNPAITDEEYVDIPVTLRLKKNIAETLRILSICYSDHPIIQDEMLSRFLEREVTKVVESLATDPPYSDGWGGNFKTYLQRLVNKENNGVDSAQLSNNQDLEI